MERLTKKLPRENVPARTPVELHEGDVCRNYTQAPRNEWRDHIEHIEHKEEVVGSSMCSLCSMWLLHSYAYPRSERRNAAGSSPRSITSTSAEPTITPSTCGASFAI